MIKTLFNTLQIMAMERGLNRTYGKRLAVRGTSPQGVFWNSRRNQIARFETLLALIVRANKSRANNSGTTTIADIGCGYGALLEYLQARQKFAHFRYQGLDINPSMIAACHDNFSSHNSNFSIGRRPLGSVDFCVFSGTFNLCNISDVARWERYIFSCLDACWQTSRAGMALNLLCAPDAIVKNRIYYANRDNFIARASARYGPTYAAPTRRVENDFTFLVSRESQA